MPPNNVQGPFLKHSFSLYQCWPWLFVLFLSATLAAIIPLRAVAEGRLKPDTQPQLTLTPEQQAWLKENPRLRVGLDPHWPPFSYFSKQGEWSGLDVDLLDRIATLLDIELIFVEADSWSSLLAKARQGEVDFMPSTAYTPDRSKDFLFTRTYLEFPVAIITHNDGPFYVSPVQLKGRRVAVAREDVAHEYLQRDYPEIIIVDALNSEEALIQLANGEVDAVIGNLANASHVIRHRGLTHLKISGLTDYSFGLRFAVHKDEPILVDIIEAVMRPIQAREITGLLNEWVHIDYEHLLIWSRIKPYATFVLISVGLVIAFFLLWNISLTREIRRRRVAESALKQSHLRLNSLANDKTQLMNTVAHDVRGPLNNILLRLELLGQKDTVTAAELARAKAKIQDQASRINLLIEQLITANALESGQFPLEKQRIDIVPPIRDAVSPHEDSARKKAITLTASYPDQAVWAEVNPEGLARIVDNLVSNAIKFSPHDSKVNLELTTSPDEATLRVIDHGPGISPSDEPLLFTRYAKLSARPTGGESSFGLGLAIVKALVDAHQGTIRAYSNPGGGTCFEVKLPVKK